MGKRVVVRRRRRRILIAAAIGVAGGLACWYIVGHYVPWPYRALVDGATIGAAIGWLLDELEQQRR